MNKSNIIVLLISLSGMPFSSYSAEKLFFTGAEVTSDSSYVYVGTAIPFSGNTLAHGFVMHLWADYQEYNYDTLLLPGDVNDTEIDAKVNSISAAIGYHNSASNYWWNAKIGAIHNNTQLTPDDPANKSSDHLTDLKLQIGGERHLTPATKINGIIDYITDRRAYWMRLRFLSLIDNNVYHGPEVITQGDPSYDAQQLGWVINGIAVQEHSTLGVKAGIRKGGDETSGYVGIELVVPY